MAEENICSYLVGLLTKARFFFFFFLLLFTLLFLASCLNSTSFGHRQKQKKEGKSVCDVMAMVELVIMLTGLEHVVTLDQLKVLF